MSEIVILTPSYNREETLLKLYESLKEQTIKNFLWIIVDDGSRDNTATLVKEMSKENIVNTKYIYQENGGKARALNRGFSECENAQVIMVVDSDDHLLSTAVSTIYDYINKYSNDEGIGGFFFHYKTTGGKILKPKGKLIDEDQVMTPYEYNSIFGKHDGCICYHKRAVEKYRYPEFKGEKYLGPTVIQMEMADTYKIVYSPKLVGVAEYQSDGLTKRGRQLRLANPMGMMYYAKLMMDYRASFSTQVKYAIAIWPYAKLSNKSFTHVLRMVKRPTLLIISFIPGQILAIYWSKKK